MSKNTIIALIAMIFILPLIYVMQNGFSKDPVLSFRGVPVIGMNAANGTVVVPNEEENLSGKPLRATLNPTYIEKITGLKLPIYEPMDLVVESVSDAVVECSADGAVTEKAKFELAAKCAANTYDKMELTQKTNLQVDPDEQLIIFGASGHSKVVVHKGKLIISYVSKDMTQGDRKREACIARIMVDHLLGWPANVEKSCAKAS